ncbi:MULTISPECIES: MerR family transcriptional regulator [unclassified Streptomyces]|uniref:MerR family transcriptional regulator n=1 Tax=unclassified Streptomyces TaxID=2593676 RepID=UPI000823EE1B|nr:MULTISPECIES: MerR family transcriptional regulator [unclassified Streptomyces]MYT97333.1 MerR family transcriptional regulator [Streptomyces sp. SID8350]SCK63035.1 DNA-binding transcriptional regulator, MerR family [Streptomyces sp. AmelKG-D3]
MRIGELSARTGASRRSLRYYEEQGLLVSSRSPSGQRHYEEEHVQRVRLIQAFLAAGMPSSTIAEMAPCMSEPTEGRARQALKIMGRERARLSEAINGLADARAALDHLIKDNHAYLAQSTDGGP